MLEYVYEQFHNDIPEQDLQEGVLKPNQVPTNMGKTSIFNTFLKSLIDQNHKIYQITNYKPLVKIQTKILSVMGPLDKAVVYYWWGAEAKWRRAYMEDLNVLV